MTELADELKRLCCAETEGKFFDCVTDNIETIIAALLAAQPGAGMPGREEIARIIEPSLFDDDNLPGYLAKDSALKKADAILALAQPLQEERETLLAKAAQDFIDKVDRGEARSKESYAAFKAALLTPSRPTPSEGG